MKKKYIDPNLESHPAMVAEMNVKILVRYSDIVGYWGFIAARGVIQGFPG